MPIHLTLSQLNKLEKFGWKYIVSGKSPYTGKIYFAAYHCIEVAKDIIEKLDHIKLELYEVNALIARCEEELIDERLTNFLKEI